MQIVVGIYPSSRDSQVYVGCWESLYEIEDFVGIIGIFGNNKITNNFYDVRDELDFCLRKGYLFYEPWKKLSNKD